MSYEKEKANLPGVKKTLVKYGSASEEDTIGTGAMDGNGSIPMSLDIIREESKQAKERMPGTMKVKERQKTCPCCQVLLGVKSLVNETDMAKLKEYMRSIYADSLVWVSCSLVLVEYGIKILQIQSIVEDDEVGTDTLQEQITALEEFMQFMDMAAFNKI